MLRLATLLLALAATTRACSVCVAGKCHEPRTLLEGFRVTDQMAIDRDNRVIYVQLDSDSNTALQLDPFKIVRLQHRNTSGLTVDQRTHALYTADHTRALYVHRWGQPAPDHKIAGVHEEADLLFYKDMLYYTSKSSSGLYFIENGQSKYFQYLKNYSITDFVVDKNNKVYFVSNDKVYVHHRQWEHGPVVVATKKYAISTDNFGNVYLGDVTVNAIFKLDESNKLIEYAAYAEGSVDRFVFDKHNAIVFHDPTSDSVGYWQPTDAKCAVYPPHAKYLIKDASPQDDSCNKPTENPGEEAGSGDYDDSTTMISVDK